MRVAAIDCGTNSIRLLIAEIEGSNFKEISRTMEIVRLGQGVDESGEFHLGAIARTLSAVDKFTALIESQGVARIRFCATSASRDARNRDLFLDGVRERMGILPEVITGAEEAELSFLGATRELSSDLGPFLVVDIGGGSTEFVFGGQVVESAKSVNIGCVRLSERHFHSDPPSAEQIKAATFDIENAIGEAALIVPIKAAKTLVAVAGTATTIAAAGLELGQYDRHAIHHARISTQKVLQISETFLGLPRAEREALGYMHPGRVDVIAAGSLILAKIMEATGAQEFSASESDILDGMAWSLAAN